MSGSHWSRTREARKLLSEYILSPGNIGFLAHQPPSAVIPPWQATTRDFTLIGGTDAISSMGEGFSVVCKGAGKQEEMLCRARLPQSTYKCAAVSHRKDVPLRGCPRRPQRPWDHGGWQ